MSGYTLVMRSKNYSSWSLRPWLLMKYFDLPFKEVLLKFDDPIRPYSPNAKVPALRDDDLVIWESLAICEYLAERHPDRAMWPRASRARAVARAVSHEMHAGFAALREHMPMNCRKQFPTKGHTSSVEVDVRRITEIWRDCRAAYGSDGLFLFGAFSIADAMYAPVVWRFTTYAVTLDPVSEAYRTTMLALPAMQEWSAAAQADPEVIPQYEL